MIRQHETAVDIDEIPHADPVAESDKISGGTHGFTGFQMKTGMDHPGVKAPLVAQLKRSGKSTGAFEFDIRLPAAAPSDTDIEAVQIIEVHAEEGQSPFTAPAKFFGVEQNSVFPVLRDQTAVDADKIMGRRVTAQIVTDLETAAGTGGVPALEDQVAVIVTGQFAVERKHI